MSWSLVSNEGIALDFCGDKALDLLGYLHFNLHLWA